MTVRALIPGFARVGPFESRGPHPKCNCTNRRAKSLDLRRECSLACENGLRHPTGDVKLYGAEVV
jgi:hypothetical protein